MVVSLSNSKGGVGKSTIAVHLAVWLREQGRRVALVDADVQGSSSIWLSDAESTIASYRLLTPDDVVDQLPEIANRYDYVVADGPAGLTEVTRALLTVSDIALFPCGPSVLDVRALMDAITALRQIQGLRDGLPHEVVIPNKLQSKYRLSQQLIDIVRSLNMPSGDGLKLRQAYAEAAQQGTVVWRMKSPGAREAAGELQYLFQNLISYDPARSNLEATIHA